MTKSSTSRFWKVYGIVTGAVVVLISVFLLFFYDFIRAYEQAQPISAAREYAYSLTEDDVSAMMLDEAGSNPYETPERIAAAFWETINNLDGSIHVEPDHTVSTANTRIFSIIKGNILIGSVSVTEDESGKYDFTTWRVVDSSAVTEFLSGFQADYEISVPAGSAVTVNGVAVDEQYLLGNTEYALAHTLERHITSLCDTYRISGLCAVPDVRCTWNGNSCQGELSDGKWTFAYPRSVLKTLTISAPTGAVVSVNNIPIGSDYIVEKERPYPYSVFDSVSVTLPTEVVYRISGLIGVPEISATMDSVPLSAEINGDSVRYPYPADFLFTQVIYAPKNSRIIVNGHTVGEEHKAEAVPAYPELFVDESSGVMMDRYILHGLFAPCGNIAATLGGESLRMETSEEGRVGTCRFLYPVADDQTVHSLILSFCKDYFAYTAGGYRNTEENLNRVLAYLQPNSYLYRRLLRSKESVGFVTPVSSQKFHVLSVDSTEELSDSCIVCSVSYDIEQWTYQTKRTYSGKLRLAFERIGNKWVLSHMLTDIK